jgi:hypothetical protein
MILPNTGSELAVTKSQPFQSLDQLYTQILYHATEADDDPTISTKCRAIVGAVVLSFARLTRRELGALLGRQSDVDVILAELHSVFLVPKGDAPIQAFHPSFHDYLTNKTRCVDPRFFVDSPVEHGKLAQRCLQRMISLLKRDICDIHDPSKLNHEVDDLEQKLANIPGDLRYACRYWASHLTKCCQDDSLVELCRTFAFNLFLHWLEVLSLIGSLREAGLALQRARQWVSVSNTFFLFYVFFSWYLVPFRGHANLEMSEVSLLCSTRTSNSLVNLLCRLVRQPYKSTRPLYDALLEVN